MTTLELIPISAVPIDGAPIETCDARALHAFLGVGRDFTTWIKERIAAYGFAEGVDFVAIEAAPPIRGTGNRGVRTDYALTLDMAKELCMVERNEKGRQARRYFIECERRAKAAAPALAVPQTLPEALRLAADLAEQVAAQSAAIAVLEPRAAALDRLAETDGTWCVRDAAKLLQAAEKDLWAYLKAHGWIYRREAGGDWIAYASRCQSGHLTHKAVPVEPRPGLMWTTQQVRVTSRGLAALALALGQPAPLALPAPARA